MTLKMVKPSDDDSDELKAACASLLSARGHIEELMEERDLAGIVLLFNKPNQATSFSRFHVEGGAIVSEEPGTFSLVFNEDMNTSEARVTVLNQIDQSELMLQVFFNMTKDHLASLAKVGRALDAMRAQVMQENPSLSDAPGSVQ